MDDSDLPEVQHRPKGGLIEIYNDISAREMTIRPSHQKAYADDNPFVCYTDEE